MTHEEIEEVLKDLLNEIESEFDYHYRSFNERRKHSKDLPALPAGVFGPPPDSRDEQGQRLLVLMDVASAELALRQGFATKRDLKRLVESAKILYRDGPGLYTSNMKKILKRAKNTLS
jgi:hypothetical protein